MSEKKDLSADISFLSSCFKEFSDALVSQVNKLYLEVVNYNHIHRPCILYHYCSIDSFYSIIETNCFWLSSPLFLNDLRENKFSFDLIRKIVQDYKINKNSLSNLYSLFLDGITDQIDKMMNSVSLPDCTEDFRASDAPPFIICFSSLGDSLPLWSMYTNHDLGVSIGLNFFDDRVYSNIGVKNNFDNPFTIVSDSMFCRMIYDEDSVFNNVSIFFDSLEEIYHRIVERLKQKVLLKNFTEYASVRTAENLCGLRFYLKNHDFDFENEIRFVLNKYELDYISYRVKKNFVVPYLKFPSVKVSDFKFPIVSVTISPECVEPDLMITSIRSFLKAKGYNTDKIKFSHSNIKFKPR